MSMIVNPCEICTNYGREYLGYLKNASEGNYGSLEGIKTIIDLAMGEEIDSEIEQILKSDPGICGERGFCVYDREDLNKRKELVNRLAEQARESELEEGEFLRLSFLDHLIGIIKNS